MDIAAQERQEIIASSSHLIDQASGVDGPDNKAAGETKFGRDGNARQYRQTGVVYANIKDTPHHKRGKKLYFLKSEIDAWLKSGRKNT